VHKVVFRTNLTERCGVWFVGKVFFFLFFFFSFFFFFFFFFFFSTIFSRMSLLECSLQSLKSLDSEEVKAMVHGSKLFAEALREGKFEHAFFALQMGASFQQDDLSSIFAGGQGLLAQQIFREVLLRGANLALSLFRILGNVPIDMDMLALCLDFIKKTPGGTDSLNQVTKEKSLCFVKTQIFF
jgi:hypothetical protein